MGYAGMRSIAGVAAAALVGVQASEQPKVSVRPRKVMPDRLSVNKDSPYYDGDILKKVGVRLNGVDRAKDVIEFDRVAGWMIVHILDGAGKPLRNSNGTWKTERLTGLVEPYWKGLAPEVFSETPKLPVEHFISAAEAKRARKAALLKAQAEKGVIAVVAVPVIDESTIVKARKPRAKKVAAL